jgi:hypothetical protein
MIKGLILCIRIYQGILITFAISTWIDGLITLPDWYWFIMVILAYPVLFLFGWASIGPIGLEFIIGLVLLDWLVKWLRRFDPEYQQQLAYEQQQAMQIAEQERLASEHQPPSY